MAKIHNQGGTAMKSTRVAGITTAAVATAIAAAGAAKAGDELPRYRLEPGMELSYTGSSTFKYQSGMDTNEEETTAWVVRKNDDGSVRIVLRQGSRSTITSVVDTIKSLFKKQNKQPMDYHVGYLDLFPDGRIGPDAEQDFRIIPATLFPRLPENADQAKTEWSQRDETMAVAFGYTSLRSQPDGWTFQGERTGPEKKIYGMTMGSTFHLDAKRGAIRTIDEEFTQGYGYKGKGSGKVELTGVEKHDAAWLAKFAPAAERYFAARKAYEKATEAASKDADKANALLAEAKLGLQKARDAIDHPIFREQLDRQIAEHASMVSYYTDTAKRRAEALGKPAANWELKGLDGKTHSLASYRGKVVVLDFWYRGCGWCIKAMPQVNALAEQFQGRPVAVLGMNTDRKEDDAKLVVQEMGLKYETLRAQGIPEKYGVQGFPTLILIDAEGKVRDVHVGYSPTLRVDVGKTIDELLAHK
jgi:thiol-disulfide isomerase/thioredoxin